MLNNRTQPLFQDSKDQENIDLLEFSILSFQIKETEVCEWIIYNQENNSFAQSLYSYLTHKGYLTIRQIAAVKDSIEEVKQIEEEKHHAREIERERAIQRAQEEEQRRARALEIAREKEETARREAEDERQKQDKLRREKELADWRAEQARIKLERLRKQKEFEEQREKLKLQKEQEQREWEEKEKLRKEPIRTKAIENIFHAFLHAKSHKKGRLRLRIGNLQFSNNTYPKNSYNDIAVKYKGDYIGVINEDGEFLQSYNVPEEALAEVLFMKSDLRKITTDHGKTTGNCACCGRELTDPKSIEMGIGPLCAERWGFNL